FPTRRSSYLTLCDMFLARLKHNKGRYLTATLVWLSILVLLSQWLYLPFFSHLLHSLNRTLPMDNVAAVIVQNRAQIVPSPTDNLKIGKVGLPHLVHKAGFILELICC